MGQIFSKLERRIHKMRVNKLAQGPPNLSTLPINRDIIIDKEADQR
jgi:hypothetical protein